VSWIFFAWSLSFLAVAGLNTLSGTFNWRSLDFQSYPIMSLPNGDSDLRKLVNKLESRVHELEQAVKSSKVASLVAGDNSKKYGMRMILMGPPGAGEIIILESANDLI